jgi:hypothetical protein
MSGQVVTAAILQPSYIPWRGFFHILQRSEVFVFYDDVQYDARGWRNRNQVKTAAGKQWLTIPVHHKGSQTRHIPINEITIDWNQDWPRKHWATIVQHYRAAPCFEEFAPLIEPFYHRHDALLADFTIETTIALARALGIDRTRFVRSSSLGAAGRKTERLIDVLKKVGAGHYISGPSARDYIEPDQFAAAGISLEYQTYDYPAYPQLHPPFDGHFTILDCLFNVGSMAHRYIWNRTHP